MLFPKKARAEDVRTAIRRRELVELNALDGLGGRVPFDTIAAEQARANARGRQTEHKTGIFDLTDSTHHDQHDRLMTKCSDGKATKDGFELIHAETKWQSDGRLFVFVSWQQPTKAGDEFEPKDLELVKLPR